MAINCYLVFHPENNLYTLQMTRGWSGIDVLKFDENCKIVGNTRVSSAIDMVNQFDAFNAEFKTEGGFSFPNDAVANLQFKKCLPGMVTSDEIGPDGDGWRTLSNYTTDYETLAAAARSLHMNDVRYKALSVKGAIVVNGSVYQPINEAVRKSTGRPSKFGFRDMAIGEVQEFKNFLEFRSARNAANSLMGRSRIVLNCDSKKLTIERIE